MWRKFQHISSVRSPGGLCAKRTVLSRADDDSRVYFIHVNEFQFDIWLHKEGQLVAGGSISLVEICTDLRMSDNTLEDEHTAVIRII